MSICTFCFKGPGADPWCHDNPGDGCTYGLHHEFAGDEHDPKAKNPPKQPAKKVDKQLCTKCGLHARNPASLQSTCQHEYPS